MRICDFTKPELETFRRECNFTDIESQCFELKWMLPRHALSSIRAHDPRHGLSENLYNILYNIRRKKGHVQHMYNNKNTTKRYKTAQNKNSGKPCK